MEVAEKLQQSSTSTTQVHCSNEVLSHVSAETRTKWDVVPGSMDTDSYMISNKKNSEDGLISRDSGLLLDAQLIAETLLQSSANLFSTLKP